jgi:2-amino-4-hydroxy-6-hydroxymethyldihydropteridine diphosphokinase
LSSHAESQLLLENQVLIGLGGNLGDPLSSMRAALAAFDAHNACHVLRASSVWRTPPWGLTDQPDFLNACAAISTSLAPRAFLELCLAIEQDLKRVRDVRWGPRSIDLDILFFGSETINESGLVVPHPRIGDRAFVLVPLAEIAGDTHYQGKSIYELAVLSDRTNMSVVEKAGWYQFA